jgi:hypothetical protein
MITKGNEEFLINEKSALWTERESSFPSDGCSRNSTLDLDYISKKVRSRPFHTLPSGGVVIWSGWKILSFLVDAEPAAPLTKKGAACGYMDPFLSSVASAFPGRAGKLIFLDVGSAKFSFFL